MPRPPTTGPASRGFLHLHLHEDELLTPQPLRWSPLVSQSGILSRFSRTFARRGKGTSLNSTCLTPKPLPSSVYVHVPEALSPRKRAISVMSLFPSIDISDVPFSLPHLVGVPHVRTVSEIRQEVIEGGLAGVDSNAVRAIVGVDAGLGEVPVQAGRALRGDDVCVPQSEGAGHVRVGGDRAAQQVDCSAGEGDVTQDVPRETV